MNIDPNLAVAVGVPAVIGLVWLVRLEGRINLGEERHAEIKKSLAEIKGEVKDIGNFIRGGVER